MPNEFMDVQKFPSFAPGNNTYLITQGDAKLNIKNLIIPDGHQIVVSAEVTDIEWVVERITFGKSTTIDLAAPSEKPGKAANGGDPGAQAPHGKIGRRGEDGASGQKGRDGVSLTLRGLRKIDNQGSLWIRTDGGPGGDGGDGGRGQQGGGPRNPDFPWGHKPLPGGNGGDGGHGGTGGSTSAIKIQYAGQSLHDRFTTGFATSCGPSNRPPGAIGNTGVIAIFGAPGCGGQGGGGGAGGLGGDVSVNNGAPGAGGRSGAEGDRIPVIS